MSSVVIDRAVLERVRDFMYPHVFGLQGAEWAPARADIAALDAALSAPEPFERDGTAALIPLHGVHEGNRVRVHPGRSRISLIQETSSGDYLMRCWENADARAIALALLALTEEER